LEWLGNLSQNLSAEMTSLVLGALGVILIILGLWLAWLVFFNRTEKRKVAIFAIILVCIILFATWQQWGWMPILIAAGSIGLAPLLVGLMIDAILEVPYLGASIVGATIAFFLGIGNSLLYLAIPGPFISEYIEMASLIGITIGAILGLLLSSRNAGYWH
jgi:hypothetical protein